jgi:transcriptional regulator with XRE-family HTH domain
LNVRILGRCIFFPNIKTALIGANPEYIDIAFGEFGERLFRRRRALGLSKRVLAEQLGVHHEMIGKWERGEHEPRVSYWPAITEFLGARPNKDEVGEFSERIRQVRYRLGWSQQKMACQLGVDERTVARWELGTLPRPSRRDRLAARIESLACSKNVNCRDLS